MSQPSSAAPPTTWQQQQQEDCADTTWESDEGPNSCDEEDTYWGDQLYQRLSTVSALDTSKLCKVGQACKVGLLLLLHSDQGGVVTMVGLQHNTPPHTLPPSMNVPPPAQSSNFCLSLKNIFLEQGGSDSPPPIEPLCLPASLGGQTTGDWNAVGAWQCRSVPASGQPG